MKNEHIRIKISDPWELGEQINWNPLNASVISYNDSAILLRLNEPFRFKDVDCEYFVASPRHEGVKIFDLKAGNNIVCGMIRISEDQANSSDPFDLSKWRGGVAIIGEIEMISV